MTTRIEDGEVPGATGAYMQFVAAAFPIDRFGTVHDRGSVVGPADCHRRWRWAAM